MPLCTARLVADIERESVSDVFVVSERRTVGATPACHVDVKCDWIGPTKFDYNQITFKQFIKCREQT